MKVFPLLSSLSASALSLAMGLAISGNASAAFISCINTAADSGTDYNISSRVSTATACTILAPLNGEKNDKLNPTLVVNVEGFFGINNWLFDGKWDIGTSETSNLFNFSGGGQSGTYTGLQSAITDIMFVFKDGNDTNLVGYRLGSTGGTYSTPFTAPPFDFSSTNRQGQVNPGPSSKDVSHISVYYRGSQGGTPPQAVPEPGVLLLMGVGLLGLAAARRKPAPA